MDTYTISNVQVNSVGRSPLYRNPRGKVVDTTDLQASIKADGVVQPILVESNGNGGYWLLDGERRWTAARALSLPTIPAIIHAPRDNKERLRIISSATLKQDIPAIVVENGEIVGGTCYLTLEMHREKMRMMDIAATIGLKPDVVGACIALASELPDVVQAVADGRLALTVYSLMKHKPDQFKLFVCQKQGQIAASYVRRCIQEWDSIKAKLDAIEDEDEEETAIEPETVLEQVSQERESEPVPSGRLLQRALASLRDVQEIEMQQRYIIEAIQTELNRLMESDS